MFTVRKKFSVLIELCNKLDIKSSLKMLHRAINTATLSADFSSNGFDHKNCNKQ